MKKINKTRYNRLIILSLLIALLLPIFVFAALWSTGTTDLTAYWTMNETSGNVIDMVGNADGILISPSIVQGAVGKIGTAYNFSGVDGVNITIADNVNLTLSNNMAISFWIRGTDIESRTQIILEKGVFNSDGYDVRLGDSGSGAGSVIFYAGTGAGTLTQTTNRVGNNRWTHIVVNVDDGTASIYINGTEANYQTQGTAHSPSDGATTLLLGCYHTGVSCFNGTLDEIGLWNRSLTTGDISNLYNNGDGLELFGSTNDGLNPRLKLILPTPLINYGTSPNQTLSFNATDRSLESVWYNYNGTNRSLTVSSGSTVSINFTLASFPYNLTLYANDSESNINSTYLEWNYKVFSNGETYNTTTYETASETFTINVTANTSLTAAHLIYDGTSYAGTKSGLVYSRTIDIPTNSANKVFYWNFTYAGQQISSTNHTQTVNLTNFSICGGEGGSIPFINFTFKDEGDSSVILNGTIPLLNLYYWLGNGNIKKNYTFTNNTANSKYAFCGTPQKTFNVDYTLQYKDQESTYPQRTLQATQSLSNATTNTTLYLLEDGIYVTFQVVNSANQVIQGVTVTATRTISGSSVSVGQGTTGSDGTVTLWLNPDFSTTFTFVSDNYDTYTTTLTPTQSSYTITLGGTTSSAINSTIRGIDYSIFPKDTYLINGTDYTFGFNLTSSYWEVSEYGFYLRLSNGTRISGGTTGTENTYLTLDYNTGNQTIIYLDYYWIINDVQTNATRYWVVMNSENTDWSIAHFFTDLKNYLNTDMFGIDNFGRLLIVFIIIFLSVGIVSYKYGLTSPLTVSTTIFGIIFFFDVVVGLIPSIKGINYLLTYMSALILVLMIFREVQV